MVRLPMHVRRPIPSRVSRSATRAPQIGRSCPNRIRSESARERLSFFFDSSLRFDGGARIRTAAEDQGGLVFDNPFHDLASEKLTGLSEGRREVDVPLLATLPIDELNLGREAHGAPSL